MPSSSRRLPVVLALLAGLAALAFLVFGNPFGPKAGGSDGVRVGEDAPSAADLPERDKPAEAGGPGAGMLATGLEAVGQGDLQLRLLLFKDKKPLVGQPVRLTSPAGERLERSTGDDGRLRFPAVRALRDWTLSIEGKGFATIEMKGVAVKARAVTDLGDLMLGEKSMLRGRVIDTKGMPLPGTSVSAYVGGGYDASQGFALAIVSSALAFPAPTEETKTDEKGLFTLAALTPGTAYEVQARHPGSAFSVQSGIVVTHDRASAVLTIVLGPGATAKGKVVDESGHGVANALVIALEDAGGRFSTTIKKDYAKTKADGTYVLDTLTRGTRYRFGVQAPGYAPVFDGMSSGTTVELELVRDFTLVKGGAIEGRVTDKTTGQPIPDARVVAIVGNMQMGPGRGGRGGRGAPGAVPGSAPGGAGAAPTDDTAATQITTTGADGRFKLEGLKPGPVALAQVKATGYADFQASRFPGGGDPWGEVRSGETLNQDVTLESGGTVTGKVMAVTPQGTVPLAGAQVAVVSMMSMFTGYPTAVSGEDGSYKIDGVKGGSQFQVTAVATGYVSPNFMDPAGGITMPESGGVVTKDLTLSAAGAVEGVVTNSKGAPISGARARTRSAPQGGRGGFGPSMFRQFLPGGGGGNVLTDADGRFRIESVPSDERMVVEVDTDEYVSGESEAFQVRSGETKDTKVVLEGGARLRGKVIDDHGAIVAGAKLRIGHLDEANLSTPNLTGRRADGLLEQRVLSSDTDGSYDIDRIRSGRTLIKVEKEGYTTYYRRDLDFKPDEVVENHVITLSKGETIGGVVKGDDGKPIAGAFVAVTKQDNPVRGFGGGAPAATPAAASSDGTVEASMDDRTDDQGRFTVENVPAGSYTVVVWFANGYQGYGQGDESALRRAVPTGSKDVELVLKKLPEGAPTGFPMPGGGGPRPSGAGGAGMGAGGVPGMGG